MSWRYRAEPLRLRNDGHTLRVALRQASALQLGEQRFSLEQLHFHTPGGERLGGERFPMSAHLVHRDSRGQLLALVVLFRVGREHPALNPLWALLNSPVGKLRERPGQMLDVSQFLPESRAYYLYDGSLTDAPCTENVRWLVLRQPLELSQTQLDTWRRRFADNMREPHPLNGRSVWAAP